MMKRDSEFNSIGHANLVELPDGSWWSSILGVRQKEKIFEAEASLSFAPSSDNEEAGICLLLNQERHYTLALSKKDNKPVLRLSYGEDLLFETECSDSLTLKFTCKGLDYKAWYKNKGDAFFTQIEAPIDGTKLSVMQGGFTGVMIGMYGTSNGKESSAKAIFSSFSYK